MTQLERLSRHLGALIDGREVLEVACGSGDFSLMAAQSAARVACIDLDTCRLRPAVLTSPDITFQQMDAASMAFPDASFDTVVIFNALFHLRECLPQVLAECLRVRRSGGTIVLVSSFKLDMPLLQEDVPALLEQWAVPWRADRLSPYALILC